MLENYSNLVSLGYQVAKADALFWLDQGKPWILEEEIQSQVCPEDVWQFNDHTEWHQENQSSLETMERHHKYHTFGKIISRLSSNLHTPFVLGKHLNPNLEYFIQNRSYARNEDECNGYDEVFLYPKHEKIHAEEKYNEYNECVKAFSHKSQLTKHWKPQKQKKQYDCSDCRKAFSQKSDLIKHQKTQERSPVDAVGVRQPSAGSPVSFYTREPIQERNLMSAIKSESFY